MRQSAAGVRRWLLGKCCPRCDTNHRLADYGLSSGLHYHGVALRYLLRVPSSLTGPHNRGRR
jgi:hypothetical protein